MLRSTLSYVCLQLGLPLTTLRRLKDFNQQPAQLQPLRQGATDGVSERLPSHLQAETTLLRVTSLLEHVDRYEVDIEVVCGSEPPSGLSVANGSALLAPAAASSSSTASGRGGTVPTKSGKKSKGSAKKDSSASGDNMDESADLRVAAFLPTATHAVTISLQRPVAVTLTVALSHPILVDSISLKLQKAKRRIMAVLPKARDRILWPGDAARMAALGSSNRLDLQRLPDWKLPLNTVALHLARMFSMEHVDQQMNGTLRRTPSSRSSLIDLKDTIQILFKYFLEDGKTLFTICDNDSQPTNTHLFIRVHSPLRAGPHGSPLLVLTLVDHDAAEKAVAAGLINTSDELVNFQNVIHQRDGNWPPHGVLCSAHETYLLKQLLLRNSLRAEPTTWQKRHVPSGLHTPYVATFLTPLYAEKAFGASYMEADPSASKEQIDFGVHKAPDTARMEAAFAEQARIRRSAAAAAAPSTSGSTAAATSASTPGAPSDAKTCASCGMALSKAKRCGACQGVWYCGANCQRKHWPIHRQECKSLAQ